MYAYIPSKELSSVPMKPHACAWRNSVLTSSWLQCKVKYMQRDTKLTIITV